MSQENLHPMNRGSFPRPDWKNPEWQPLAYPPPSELPFKGYGRLGVEAKEALIKRFPTLADYYNYEYGLMDAKSLCEFEPRRIVPPGGFPSPKGVASSLFGTMLNVMLKYSEGAPVAPTEISAMLLSYKVLEARVPVFYVSDAFIRAVAATELPSDFTLQDLNWPMPALALGLPTKFSREFTGRDIGYLFAADIAEGDHKPPRWGKSLPTIASPNKVCFQFNSYNNGQLESFVTSWMKRERLDTVVTKYGYTDYTDATPAKLDDDKLTAQKVGALLLKLIVVLNTRPGYLESGQLTRPAKTNKRTGKTEQSELWSPNIIGFKYAPQRQPAAGGTHASPKWHWRRGHITHQRIGSFKNPEFVAVADLPHITEGDHKGEVDWLQVPDATRAAFWRCHVRRWIEPTLINFDE